MNVVLALGKGSHGCFAGMLPLDAAAWLAVWCCRLQSEGSIHGFISVPILKPRVLASCWIISRRHTHTSQAPHHYSAVTVPVVAGMPENVSASVPQLTRHDWLWLYYISVNGLYQFQHCIGWCEGTENVISGIMKWLFFSDEPSLLYLLKGYYSVLVSSQLVNHTCQYWPAHKTVLLFLPALLRWAFQVGFTTLSRPPLFMRTCVFVRCIKEHPGPYEMCRVEQ